MAFKHNIKTSHDNPSIPTREHDWSAWFDWASPDDDHFISGNGETEHAAVADLIQKAAEANEPRYHGEVVDMAFAFWSAPKWQPIETAPETGEFFVIADFRHAKIDHLTFDICRYDPQDETAVSDWFYTSTHWKPLPNPPKESE